MTTQAIHLSSPVDLITSLPYTLGFHPKRSVVLVNLKGNRLGLTQRIDIPPPEHAQDAANAMVGPMLQDCPTSVVLLGYEDVEGESIPLLNALMVAISNPHLHPSAASFGSIGLDDVLVVRDGRWYSRVCKIPTCCPPEGTPLAENAAVASEFIGLGHSPLSSREDVAARVEAKFGAVSLPTIAEPDTAASLAAWAKVLTTGQLSRQETEDAALALLNINFRDAMVAHTCPGFLPWDLVDDELKAVFETMPKIVHEGAIDRLIDLCSALADDSAAPALTVLANYAWMLGDGGITRMALERALRCDPNYRLAQLLERMVEMAIRPVPET
jgi:hypothetical protein